MVFGFVVTGFFIVVGLVVEVVVISPGIELARTYMIL